MTRAALVVCVMAAAATTPLTAARAGSDVTTPGSTFVVRGVVVQYIPPSGSMVGSLSIRVRSVGARGRALLGELVTVAVDPGTGLKPAKLHPQRSLCTITLQAKSPVSILKGAARVRTIVLNAPPAGGGGAGAKQTSGSTATSGDQGSGQSIDRGNSASSDGAGGGSKQDGGSGSSASVDHGQGQSTDHGNAASGNGGSGNSKQDGASTDTSSGDHGQGQSTDHGSGANNSGSASQAANGAGNANGHK